jgi:predicted metal-dependent phosphoesterase TrpH
MKYDLHVHTSRYSLCAASSPEAVCRTAIQRGLKGIALTEHEVWWPAAEYEALRRQFPQLTIFHGVEYAIPEGHFLVFLPNPRHYLPYLNDLQSLFTAVRPLGGILIWAHPFRYDRSEPSWLHHMPPDAMEVASSNMSHAVQSLARQVAEQRRITALQNSDAHQVRSVGRYYNEIPVSLKSNQALVKYLRTCSQEKTTRS